MTGAISKSLGFFSIVLVLCSEIFYIRSGYGPVSLFFISSLFLAILWVILFPRIPVHRLIGISYCFVVVLSLYVIAGIFLYERASLLAQFVFVLVLPFIFIHLGYFGNVLSSLRLVVVFIFLCTAIALCQFFYLILDVAGPAGVFRATSEFFLDIQGDFLAENIYGRSTGIFANPNSLGLFSGLAFWFIYSFGRNLPKVLRIGAIAATTVCLLLSTSRGSLVGMAASLFAYISATALSNPTKFNLGRRSSMWAFGFILIFIVSVNILPDGHLTRLAEVFDVASSSGLAGSENLGGRVQAWEAIISRLDSYPFGTLVPPQLVIDESPDNQFIFFLAQGGILLLLAAISFYVALIFSSFALKNDAARVMLASVVFISVNSLTMIVLNNFVIALFWLIVGSAIRLDLSGNSRKLY